MKKYDILEKISDNTSKLNKVDYLILLILILIYGIISFYHLGDFKVPKTYKTFERVDDEVIISLKKEEYVNKMRYYTGYNTGLISIMISTDGENYKKIGDIEIDKVFSWEDYIINDDVKYMKIISNKEKSTLGDIMLYGLRGKKIIIPKDKNNPLLDETNLVPKEISYLNSTYFDEVYYARTAYEYTHNIPGFEWSHPPLGKIIISIPVYLFGFSPFTFRLMNNLFGIILIPIMYILAKKIFKNRKWALLGGLLMMFDNFHFAHTRICLIDGIQVTFILLSVLFMKNYLDLKKKDRFKLKAINLLLSGLFIGCAISTKWNASYILIGLAVIFFSHLLKEYKINIIKIIKKKLTLNIILKYLKLFIIIPISLYFIIFIITNKEISKTIIILYSIILLSFYLFRLLKIIIKDKYLLKLTITCIISFILIPVSIYILSYIISPKISYYKDIIDMNKMMYYYHSNLNATHPFSSKWYEWPIMLKPVWFYIKDLGNGKTMTISDIGNPSIWWFGLVAFIYLIISSLKEKNKNNRFILLFILSSYLPYILIGRLMFMYHYFITLPFIMLGIVSFIKWISEINKTNKIYYLYLLIIIIVFIIYYPVVSGLPISNDYKEAIRLYKSWHF